MLAVRFGGIGLRVLPKDLMQIKRIRAMID
jgi:hypothetical protein